MSQPEAALRVQPATDDDRAGALGLVFAHLPADELKRRVAQALSLVDSPTITVWTAHRGEQLAAAALIEMQPGKTAIISPPQPSGEQSPSAIRELLIQVIAILPRQHVRLAQVFLPNNRRTEESMLIDAGFRCAATLLYLVSLSGTFPKVRPDDEVEFLSYSPALDQRFAKVVERTYAGSLDCPSVDEVRAIEDVLEGYRAAGVFDPARWLIVRRRGNDVGCLLLADDPVNNQWELNYMGVVPEARGLALGRAIVRHAQWLAAQAGRERLVLAVDANNEPAIAVYAAANFVQWDERRLFLRVL
jgi:ribosomal protein S18 acetylase RimI-like enzyme